MRHRGAMVAMEVEYLRDWDLLWMASDAKGQVGVFITAGEGPIPKTMVSGIDDLAEVGEEMLLLPPRCEHRLWSSCPGRMTSSPWPSEASSYTTGRTSIEPLRLPRAAMSTSRYPPNPCRSESWKGG